MNDIGFLWDLYWPVLAVAFGLGLAGGLFWFRWPPAAADGAAANPPPRRGRHLGFAIALLAALGFAALWHGPLGAARHFQADVEQTARTVLDHYEMYRVDARLDREPLTRSLVLSGPADDFQRSELVRIMREVPGVGSVRWSDSAAAGFQLPLLAIAALAALSAFGLGLLLSYLIELRRRSRAEWRW